MYKKFENLANDSETLNYKFPMPKSSAGDPTVRGFIAVDEKMKEHDDKHTERENQLQTEIDALEIKVDSEIKDRQNADNEINAKLDKEIADRTQADTALGERIDAIDNSAAEIENLKQKLDKEISDRTQADTDITGNVTMLESEVGDLKTSVSEVKKNLATETSNREQSVTGLQAKIEEEVNNRNTAVTDLQSQITKEIDDRKVADTAINARIDALGNGGGGTPPDLSPINQKIDKEIQDRTNADNALSQKIDKEIQDRTSESARLQQQITQESQVATNGINALTNSVNGLATQVNGKLDINGIILKEKTGQDAFIAGNGTPATLAELNLEAGLHIISGQVLAKVDSNTGSLTMAITDRTDFSQIPCYEEVPFKSGAYISGNMTYLIYLPHGGTYRILAKQTSGQDSLNSTYFIQAIKLRP